jgi:hypothetical protein
MFSKRSEISGRYYIKTRNVTSVDDTAKSLEFWRKISSVKINASAGATYYGFSRPFYDRFVFT